MKIENDVIRKRVGRSVKVKAVADVRTWSSDFEKIVCYAQSYIKTMNLPAFVRNKPIRKANL